MQCSKQTRWYAADVRMQFSTIRNLRLDLYLWPKTRYLTWTCKKWPVSISDIFPQSTCTHMFPSGVVECKNIDKKESEHQCWARYFWKIFSYSYLHLQCHSLFPAPLAHIGLPPVITDYLIRPFHVPVSQCPHVPQSGVLLPDLGTFLPQSRQVNFHGGRYTMKTTTSTILRYLPPVFFWWRDLLPVGKGFFTSDHFFKLNYFGINCGISGDSGFRNMKYIANVLCFVQLLNSQAGWMTLSLQVEHEAGSVLCPAEEERKPSVCKGTYKAAD